MDYKYIEQLLERYWACETSVGEEKVLRAFFCQDDVPAHLVRYKALFEYGRDEAAHSLSEDFDRRLCALVQQEKPAPVVKIRRLTLSYRLRPFFRATASVAIVLLLGMAAQHSFNREENASGWDYNMATYTDTYQNPQEAYEAGIKALGMFSAAADSVKPDMTNTIDEGEQ